MVIPMTEEQVACAGIEMDNLPCHGVWNPAQGKFGVVYYTAASSGDASSNDYLISGADLASSLIGVLMHFRPGTVTLSADAEAVFNQVHVPSMDMNPVRFCGCDVNDTFERPHVFGAKYFRCCANYAQQRTAHDNEGKF